MAHSARQIAFGGMMTAVAVVIMSLGSLIPVNTYTCPMLCILLTKAVQERCGRKLSWCYYLASAFLSLLLAPDREAALVYAFLGYYPLIRHWFDRVRPVWVRETCKLVYFTLTGVGSYGLTALVIGADVLLEELRSSGLWLMVATVLLWDLLLIMVDRLLGMKPRRRNK